MYEFIGYACGAGAKEHACFKGPTALRHYGIVKFLQDQGINAHWQDIYHLEKEKEQSHSDLKVIRNYCRHLAKQTQHAIEEDHIPVTIGGDHSMAIGTWSGVAKGLDAEGDLGLIWFDAHMDAHTEETTPSGAIHGMPLACLLGYGKKSLTKLCGCTPVLNPEHVCLIGVRSFENGEAKLLETLGVRIFFIEEVQARGPVAVIKDALAIAKRARAGFGVSLDLDALDPSVVPGTGSKEKNGIYLEEMLEMLELISREKSLRAFELAEFHPALDDEHKTAKLICVLLKTALSKGGL